MGPAYVYMYVCNTFRMSQPPHSLCANNFEMHMFVLIKNGGRPEKRYWIVCLKLAVSMKILAHNAYDAKFDTSGPAHHEGFIEMSKAVWLSILT